MKKFIVSLVLSLAVSASFAQSRFFIEAGAVSSGYTQKVDTQQIFTGNKWGATFGFGFDSRITKRLYVQPGLTYVMNGFMQNTTKGDLAFTINTLQLPLNVMYKNEKPGNNRIFASIGPYFGVNMFGSKKYTPRDSTVYIRQVNVGSDSRDDIRAFDFGVGLNGGYEMANGFFVRVHYQLGLINQSERNDDFNVLKCKNSGITIGFITGANKEKKLMRRGRTFRSHGIEM